MKNILNKIKKYNITPILFSCAFFCVLFTYALITTYSSDDYGYSLFLDNGVSGWVQMMQNHYHFVNGRTFVHLVATAILHFNNIVFSVFFSINLIIIAVCFRSNQTNKSLFWLLFLCGWILTPRPILVEGVLWISGFCNYVLPTAMTALLFYQSRNALSKNVYSFRQIVWLLILSFLSGATTEQSGIALCILLILIFIEALSTHNVVYAKICLVQILFAIVGIASIFLSPATRLRVDREMYYIPVSKRITNMLLWQKDVFLANPLFIILVAAVPILILIKNYKQKGNILIAAISAMIEICLALMILTGGNFSVYCYGILLLLLLILAVSCWLLCHREIGSLLCYAVVTVFVMLPTQSIGYRTLLPMYIILLSLFCELFCDSTNGLIAKQPKLARFFAAILVLFAVGTVIHDLPHYYYNHKIDMINAEYAKQAKSEGVLYYCMDYDDAYTHVKAYQDGYFYSEYIKTLRLSSPLEHIFFYGENLPIVFVNDVRVTSPGIKSVSGEWLISLRDVIEHLGGAVIWSEKGTQIVFNQKTYNLFKTSNGFNLSWQDDNGEHDINMPARMTRNYFATMLPVDFYRDILDLNVEVDSSAIYVSSKND